MKQFVTDANVLFSGLISGNEKIIRFFGEYTIYTPDFALVEIQKYQELILSKTKVEPQKLRDYTLSLFKNIIVVPNLIISNQSYYKAFNLCKNVDEKDTPYLALSIELEIHLLTQDEKLATHLKQEGFAKVISLTDFLSEI